MKRFTIDDDFIELLVVVRAAFIEQVAVGVVAGGAIDVLAEGAGGSHFVFEMLLKIQRCDHHVAPLSWQKNQPVRRLAGWACNSRLDEGDIFHDQRSS